MRSRSPDAAAHLEPDVVCRQLRQHVLTQPIDDRLPRLTAHAAPLLRLDTENRVQNALGCVDLVSVNYIQQSGKVVDVMLLDHMHIYNLVG